MVPQKFKLAKIIPVYKNGSEVCVNNYRPIALLSVFNKILEKLMFSRLMSFINQSNLLYNKQFGFRQNHSTLHAILSTTDKVQKAIDDRNFSCGLFLDLSKAFDTVDQSILLQKLHHYGIRGIAHNWFKSYLDNRQQFVSIGNVNSDTKQVLMEVPQGSVLGPLLFLLYINDFQNSSNVLDFHLFADDSNLFYSNKSLSDLEAKINIELQSVYNWLCANKLSLNIEKSNFVKFHPVQK